jgi:hypothetical protein
MSNQSSLHRTKTVVLVEAPEWGDAEFYGQWLLAAAKALELLHQAKNDDPKFRAQIETLECVQCIDFGILATVFLSQLVNKEFYSFSVKTNSDDLWEFTLMADMGFFTLTGDRYQMTLPTNLDITAIKKAHLRLAETEDEDWIHHPERLVVAMPSSRARMYQRLLRDMSQTQRLADRRALLFLD